MNVFQEFEGSINSGGDSSVMAYHASLRIRPTYHSGPL